MILSDCKLTFINTDHISRLEHLLTETKQHNAKRGDNDSQDMDLEE